MYVLLQNLQHFPVKCGEVEANAAENGHTQHNQYFEIETH